MVWFVGSAAEDGGLVWRSSRKKWNMGASFLVGLVALQLLAGLGNCMSFGHGNAFQGLPDDFVLVRIPHLALQFGFLGDSAVLSWVGGGR